MAQSNNGQLGMRKGALDMANRKKFLKGGNFEFNGSPNDFWQGGYNQIPSSAFDMLGVMNNEIESITGTKSFSGGINSGSLGDTATGARGALDATATRRMNVVRNISENLVKPLMRKWMSYNSEFLEEEEVVRITNDEYVPIRRDDLAGRVDIDLSISTAEDNAAKSQELSFLLQTLGPSEDPAIRRDIMADIMGLMRMPEQEKRMREYKPEPDPMQEQLKQIELERLTLANDETRAKIESLRASSQEDIADEAEKLAKARKLNAESALKEAQTSKVLSEKDKLDLDFLKSDEGVSHQEKLELEEQKRRANLDSMAFQASQDDKAIGVIN
jgi:hypothetical protein